MESGEIRREMFCTECNRHTEHYIWKQETQPEGKGKKKTFRVYFYCQCSACSRGSKKNLPVEEYNELVLQNEKEPARWKRIPKEGVKREMACKDCGDINIHLIKFPEYDPDSNAVKFAKKCMYCDEKKQFSGGAKFIRDKMTIETWNEFIKAGN